MMEEAVENAAAIKGGLLDLVFSWSLRDVLNQNLYKHKVKDIPETFASTCQYMNSFLTPLIEEIHADLLSSMTTLSQAPACEIVYVRESKDFEPPNALLYVISTQKIENGAMNAYKPEPGDLFALTDSRPKCIDDLDKPGRPYHIAFVQGVFLDDPSKFSVASSKLIDLNVKKNGPKESLYATFLINMTTNLRIWSALNIGIAGKNLNIIQAVLHADSKGTCDHSPYEGDSSKLLHVKNLITPFNLNDSQEAAVLSCISTRECSQPSHVNLIWGPPGTGKTKTVGSLLFALLKMQCRTVACAPTNIAVLEVASRLVKLVRESVKYDTYGLGDIVLFGNGKRMKISDRDDLIYFFLDYRVEMLQKCFEPLSGWNHTLTSMISFLSNPMKMYTLYLQKNSKQQCSEPKNDEKEKHNNCNGLLGFEDFTKQEFNRLAEDLKFCITTICTHLPTCSISSEVAMEMIRAHRLLSFVASLLRGVKVGDKGLMQPVSVLKKYEYFDSSELSKTRIECLRVLECLCSDFVVPFTSNAWCESIIKVIKAFCMENAYLLFCTASSSIKLHTKNMPAVEFVVIDEAAQLKECESAIPLQLVGLRQAVLIGDELQLPAMVKSKTSEEAGFGRSLFQRLVMLGHKKHLLNIQYRMHPSISVFPMREFYEEKILDASNVKEKSHEKRFLPGKMFGTFSFINVGYGKEGSNGSHSLKNMVEVSVIAELVERLHRESVARKHKLSVGVISPYKAQVFAIQNKIGKKYETQAEGDFCLNIRSVDGYQGGEDDIIIISTVRCNASGSVGFLSNRQRTNVALTRARYCLWVLGNGPTLSNSSSVWENLVSDAKDRQCFYDSHDDKSLAQAIAIGLLELDQVDHLLDLSSKLFVEARWKVIITKNFWKSMVKIRTRSTQKKVLSLLEKLSTGWRKPLETRNLRNSMKVSSTTLEVYDVDGFYNIVWTVDIVKESLSYVQVLKIWDVLPSTKLPSVAKHLEDIIRQYRTDIVSRCNVKRVEGNFDVPVEWPEDSQDEQLSTQLALLELENEPDQLSSSYRNQCKSNVMKGRH